jgi:hypothetical protein
VVSAHTIRYFQEIERTPEATSGTAILHPGSGSSDLSNRLRELVSSRHQQENSHPDTSSTTVILNVDFAAAAIEIGRRRERAEFGDDKNTNSPMRWAVVDLLEWTSFKRACDEHCGNGKIKFNLIVEKSCTDALACGADVQLGPFSSDGSKSGGLALPLPIPRELYSRLFAPEAVVAVCLAAVTQPGGAWVALSYSGERFDFLRDAEQPAAAMWSVERVQRVVASDGVEAPRHGGTVVHRPEIVHFVYTIRRIPGMKEVLS